MLRLWAGVMGLSQGLVFWASLLALGIGSLTTLVIHWLLLVLFRSLLNHWRICDGASAALFARIEEDFY
jgi:hypothetical protein